MHDTAIQYILNLFALIEFVIRAALIFVCPRDGWTQHSHFDIVDTFQARATRHGQTWTKHQAPSCGIAIHVCVCDIHNI